MKHWESFLKSSNCMFLNLIFFILNSNCFNLLDMINLQKQVKKAFCYQKLFWPFTVFSSDLKIVANSRPSASNFKRFSRSLEQFFLTVGQNNFGNKIPFLTCSFSFLHPKYLFTSQKVSCRWAIINLLVQSKINLQIIVWASQIFDSIVTLVGTM